MILVIDTATRTGVLGLASAGGELIAADSWKSAHRHGEELLSRLDRLLGGAGAAAHDIDAIAIGIGPGSFTGLRIGLATAKTLAYGLGIPLTGVATTHALALAAGIEGEVVVALPAGANDRYVARVLVSGGRVDEVAAPSLTTSLATEAAQSDSVPLVAVDLAEPEVPAPAVAIGRRAVDHLAAALAGLGAAALAAGEAADPAELVPAYVALPRGLAQAAASVEWSPDLR